MSFVVYDLIFLAAFTIFVVIFLYSRRKNLERQGWIYLYKTKIGINFIDKFAKKYEKILRPFQYVVLVSGYILLISICWLLAKTVYLYVTVPAISETIKAPPLAPLIPYFPTLFGLESFFPPLYFTYFIIVLAVVAVSHEFSHGIFARLNGLKIKSTGFAFLGPILGAFVDPDEKQLNKARKFSQMTVLAAGTFANMIMVIVFGIILVIFFNSGFTPGGVYFSGYSISAINVSVISGVGNLSADGSVPLDVNGTIYYTSQEVWDNTNKNNIGYLLAYDDSPAFRAKMQGAIIEIDGMRIKNYSELGSVIKSHKPGDEIFIRTAYSKSVGANPNINSYNITLGDRNGTAFLGISVSPLQTNGLMGWFYQNVFAKIKDPMIYYDSKWGELGWFVYYLLWWIVVINFFVALFNMLPLGILDGGRFFYLIIWGLTGKEKYGAKAFRIMTWLILFVFVALMVRWIWSLF